MPGPRPRRALLASAGYALAGLAGCATTANDTPTATECDTECPTDAPASLLDTEFETSGGDDPAGTAESATVSFDAEALTVVVAGEIANPSIPADARLVAADYDADVDVLAVRVESYTPTPTDDGTPTSNPSWTRVEYRFTGAFEGSLPATVRVFHGDDEDPVTEATLTE